jgi:DNA transposition AAA+ family ATPase
MSRSLDYNFIVTREYRRFAEFCDACQQYRYIGLCYGPPGVGKTLSARHYADWNEIESMTALRQASIEDIQVLQEKSTLFYTPTVVNAPRQIDQEIQSLRGLLYGLHTEPLRREEEAAWEQVRCYEEERKREMHESLFQHDWLDGPLQQPPRTRPTYEEIAHEYEQKRRIILDPTHLILVDEADRLKVAGLEQMRAIFDEGGIGLVLLGMPGLEKRLGRYPQLYSRVGFVHEFRPLNAAEVRSLLEQNWKPVEVSNTLTGITAEEVLVSIVRITGGNFRLLHRLLTQIARVMEINAMSTVTRQVVETARESLVIGSN